MGEVLFENEHYASGLEKKRVRKSIPCRTGKFRRETLIERVKAMGSRSSMENQKSPGSFCSGLSALPLGGQLSDAPKCKHSSFGEASG